MVNSDAFIVNHSHIATTLNCGKSCDFCCGLRTLTRFLKAKQTVADAAPSG